MQEVNDARGRTILQVLLSTITTTGVNATTHKAEAARTTDGPDGA
jgi:hypothetical protein